MAENLTVLCDGHHAALHDGKLTITGKAPKLDVRVVKHAHVGAAVERNAANADADARRRLQRRSSNGSRAWSK